VCPDHAEYARRAGIEGTISRGLRSTRLRRTRYLGLQRVRLGHMLTAAGLNVLRLGGVVPGDHTGEISHHAVRTTDGACTRSAAR
jgi:hypothetical protein